MTTQEKIDFIRSKCIEANPSILDLVFGCEFAFVDELDSEEQGKPKQRDVVVSIASGVDSYQNPFTHIIGVSNEYDFSSKEEIEILGRDIRLPDVLMAIRKGKYAPSLDFAVDPNHISIQEENTDADEMFCIWNLLDDNLEHQSEETIEFVYNLLANNK